MSRRPTIRAFNATCTINATVQSANSKGEWAKSGVSARHTGVRCRIQPSSTRENERLFGQTVDAEYIVFMDAVLDDGTAVTVENTDEILVGSTNYKAVGSPGDQGGEGDVLAVPVATMGADR